jgi:hypothetical protein
LPRRGPVSVRDVVAAPDGFAKKNTEFQKKRREKRALVGVLYLSLKTSTPKICISQTLVDVDIGELGIKLDSISK